MTWRGRARRVLSLGAALPRAGLARLLPEGRRAPRFAGAWHDRAAAVGASGPRGYDDDRIAGVSFDVMCVRAIWDYPLLFWLDRLLPDHPVVIDAGGHMGTKYIAFADLLNLAPVRWTVFDLPGIVRAARVRQDRGDIPAAIHFADRLDGLAPCDVLIGSGLLQYLDRPFSDFVAALAEPPEYILLNKVALREGPAVFTLERIGANRVPYHIRDRAAWESEIAAMGYEIVDGWAIPELGHVIVTHPWLGRSESRGYVLRRRPQGLRVV
ncbi:methyltransferase, TIGR04325 family [Oceaniglobus trochenteri]|uniref:methyltransferase, TIGR04325 family n=1 Tax=Oceaniglobus trochenteri TaxID=2763260 RepID=UPI001CFFD866|nr:methyltransferase, TIGR04325 family [Oceaniglobus trochenteri]